MSAIDRKAMCNICKAFTLNSNLKRHMRSKHGIATTNPMKTSEPSGDGDVICKFCKKIFKRRKALLHHYRTVHANDPGVLSECAWVETYACHLCSYKTTRKNALNCHVTKTHVNPPTQTTVNHIKCPMCQFESTRDTMLEHYQSTHDVRLVLEKFKFNSEAQFNEWKSKIEEEDSSKFSRTDYYKCADSRTKVVYRCQRDGIYKAKGKNTRRPKSSSKINAVCPASLKVEIEPDGKTGVSYCKTHVGHSGDAVQTRLTKVERDEIARKIIEGLSFDQIMDLFRSDKNRLKRKDLHNIVRDYNLQKETQSGDDLARVESWIQEMLFLDNVIRFYKPLGGVLSEYPNLEANDLILVIMNDAQVEMARRNGANVICACEVLAAEISLMTISILDELGRGVPVAFMFSNSISAQIVDIFVICFKEAIGYKLKPRILITDVDDVFSSTWSKHMFEPDSRLYCLSCVEQSWSKNVEKIKAKEKQVGIRTALNLMKVEPNKAIFSSLIKNALDDWNSHPDTKLFGRYFELFYSRWPSRWACSSNAALDLIQVPFQTLHETISQIFLIGNARPKGLDGAVNALMKHLRDFLLEGFVHLSKNDAIMRLQSVKSRHDAATVIAVNRIVREGDLWKIPTRNGLKMHEVKTSKTDCRCEVKCDECKACIHSYTCSCSDSTLKFNFCKHIHAVCQHVLRATGVNSSADEGLKDNYRFINSADLPDAPEHTISDGDGPVTDMEQEKQRLIMEFTAIVNRVNSAEHVKFIDKSLKFLKTFPTNDHNFPSLNGEGTSKLVYVAVPTIPTLSENNSKNPSETLKLVFQNGVQLPHRTLEGVETCILTYVPPR